MSSTDYRDRVFRLWRWSGKRFEAAFHAVGDSKREERMRQTYAIIKRVRPLAVKAGILHRDCLEWD